MKNSLKWMIPALMAVATLGCAQPAAETDTQADVAAINNVREREIAFVSAGNVDSLLTVFTNDVVFMPPNEPAINGKEALRTWMAAMFEQIAMTGRYTSSEVTVSGDWAVDRYTGVLTGTPKAGGSPTEETIKGIHIMQRQSDGTWLIAQDLWNSDATAPPPPPPPPTTTTM